MACLRAIEEQREESMKIPGTPQRARASFVAYTVASSRSAAAARSSASRRAAPSRKYAPDAWHRAAAATARRASSADASESSARTEPSAGLWVFIVALSLAAAVAPST